VAGLPGDISGIACPLTNVGLYDVSHDPFVYFDDVTQDEQLPGAALHQHVRPYSQLDDGPHQRHGGAYNFITPNLCNDMHDRCKPLHDRVWQGDT